MIKLNYLLLNSNLFKKALVDLSQQKGFRDIKASYNVLKIARVVEANIIKAQREYQTWIKDFIVLEDGKPKKAEVPNPICQWEIIPEKKDEFYTKVEEFLKTEINIHVNPITIDELGSAQVSPECLQALEPIFDPSAFDDQPQPSAP